MTNMSYMERILDNMCADETLERNEFVIKPGPKSGPTSNARPEIVCLVGSTRFREEYDAANRMLTLQGKIVLTCGVWVHHEAEKNNAPEVKVALDILHRQKIEMADSIYVINPEDYIGQSTKSEIEYAKSLGRPIFYLESHHSDPPLPPVNVPDGHKWA